MVDPASTFTHRGDRERPEVLASRLIGSLGWRAPKWIGALDLQDLHLEIVKLIEGERGVVASAYTPVADDPPSDEISAEGEFEPPRGGGGGQLRDAGAGAFEAGGGGFGGAGTTVDIPEPEAPTQEPDPAPDSSDAGLGAEPGSEGS